MPSITIANTRLLELIKKNHNVFSGLLVFIFLCIGLLGILNHAMWRDEINVWLITRDSTSIVELFRNVKYEGHPALWYLCLYLLNQLTSNPVAMQIFHLFLATGFVYVFVQFSPFTRWQKVLFVFGYLPFYEYLLISRNYAIGVLFLFCFCALYPNRKKGYILLSSVLFLLANTNAYALLISFSLGLTLIADFIFDPELRGKFSEKKVNLATSFLIYITGILTSLSLLIPPSDSTLAAGWHFTFDMNRLVQVIVIIWKAYIRAISPGESEALVFAFVSIGLFIFVSACLIRKPIAFFLNTIGALIILSFSYVKFLGGERHNGHLYLLLISCLWIASYYPESNLVTESLGKVLPKALKDSGRGLIRFADQHKKKFIIFMLSAQFAAGVVAFTRDLLIPFSSSRSAARYIQAEKLDKMFIVGTRDYAISPICGYLNRKVYYPEYSRIGSFVLYTKSRKEVNVTETLDQVSQLIKQNSNILLILNQELKESRLDLKISFLSKFTEGFNQDEHYYLYRISSAF